MICKRCGTKLKKEDYFCVVCGSLKPSVLKGKKSESPSVKKIAKAIKK